MRSCGYCNSQIETGNDRCYWNCVDCQSKSSKAYVAKIDGHRVADSMCLDCKDKVRVFRFSQHSLVTESLQQLHLSPEGPELQTGGGSYSRDSDIGDVHGDTDEGDSEVPQEDVESTTTEAEIRVIGTEGDELIYEADIADDQRRAVHEGVQEVATEGETEESRDDYDLESVSTESEVESSHSPQKHHVIHCRGPILEPTVPSTVAAKIGEDQIHPVQMQRSSLESRMKSVEDMLKAILLHLPSAMVGPPIATVDSTVAIEVE